MLAGSEKLKTAAIILAAGKGLRLGGDEPKQFRRVGDREMFLYSLEKFLEHPGIETVVLVVPRERLSRIRRDYAAWGEKIIVVPGGDTRRDSSMAGVEATPSVCTHVLIHDAARPWFSRKLADRLLEALGGADAVVPAIEVIDSQLSLDPAGKVCGFPERQTLRRIQTPQGFHREVIRRAHEMALNDNRVTATDDAGLVFHFNLADIEVIRGEESNIKITKPGDLEAAPLNRD